MRNSHEHFSIFSNRPSSDDDPRIPRTSGGEEDNAKRSLGFFTAERSNNVTSKPRLRLGQKARLLVQKFVGNGYSAKASSAIDPRKSKALITDPIIEEEAPERSKRDVGNGGPTTQQMGLPSIPPKDCKRMKTRNPSKKPHNVVRLDRVLSRMRSSSLKAQLKLCLNKSIAPKKRHLGSSKKPNSKAMPPLNSRDTIKENSQG
ncbi:hypothetical protein Ancab_035556 [Ancistrocladus abbreviatus]